MERSNRQRSAIRDAIFAEESRGVVVANFAVETDFPWPVGR